MNDQLPIPGTEPAPDPTKTPEDDARVYAWLDAKAAQKKAAQTVKDAHLIMVTALQERGIDRYPYVDQFTGDKKYIAVERAPKAKTTRVPKPKRAKKPREKKQETPPEEQVEHRKVPRASVEAEIDPFGAVRKAMH